LCIVFLFEKWSKKERRSGKVREIDRERKREREREIGGGGGGFSLLFP
jgi:hypothetical protein